MISDSLLFQMGYIFPDISMKDIIASSLVTFVLIFFWFVGCSYLKYYRCNLPILSHPKVNDPQFVEHLARYIRAKFALKYPPFPSHAHTPREINHYVPEDDPYLSILRRLENIEYTSKKLSEGEKKEILELMDT